MPSLFTLTTQHFSYPNVRRYTDSPGSIWVSLSLGGRSASDLCAVPAEAASDHLKVKPRLAWLGSTWAAVEASGFLQLEGPCLLGVSLHEITSVSLFLFSMALFLPAFSRANPERIVEQGSVFHERFIPKVRRIWKWWRSVYVEYGVKEEVAIS